MDVAIRIADEVSQGRRSVFWNEELSHHLAEPELQDILNEARSTVWKSSAAAGARLGARLYRMIDGSGGQLMAACKATHQRGVPLHLYLEIPSALDARPFACLLAAVY